MDYVPFNRIALPVAGFAFFILLVLLPSIRLLRTSGSWPIAWSRPASGQMAPGLLFAVVLAGVAACVLVYGVYGPDVLGVIPTSLAQQGLGWMAIVGAFGVVMVAQAHMGAAWRIGIDPNRTPLVESGIFRLSRHPIYGSLLMGLLGVALVAPTSWIIAACPLAAWSVVLQIHAEERHMLALHGDRYRDYSIRVGWFAPRFGRCRSSGRLG